MDQLDSQRPERGTMPSAKAPSVKPSVGKVAPAVPTTIVGDDHGEPLPAQKRKNKYALRSGNPTQRGNPPGDVPVPSQYMFETLGIEICDPWPGATAQGFGWLAEPIFWSTERRSHNDDLDEQTRTQCESEGQEGPTETTNTIEDALIQAAVTGDPADQKVLKDLVSEAMAFPDIPNALWVLGPEILAECRILLPDWTPEHRQEVLAEFKQLVVEMIKEAESTRARFQMINPSNRTWDFSYRDLGRDLNGDCTQEERTRTVTARRGYKVIRESLLAWTPERFPHTTSLRVLVTSDDE